MQAPNFNLKTLRFFGAVKALAKKMVKSVVKSTMKSADRGAKEVEIPTKGLFFRFVTNVWKKICLYSVVWKKNEFYAYRNYL